MAEVYSLYLMEILMQSNGTLSFEDAWRYFLMQFPQTWDNFSDFESFVLSQPVLFGVQSNFIFLKDTQPLDSMAFISPDYNPIYPVTHVHVAPPPPPPLMQIHDFVAETEAVKYFQRQIGRRSETWVPIKSLAGHLSQASANIRSVVGPQSDFIYFLLRHPRIFEVQGDLVSLRDEIKSAYLPRPSAQLRQNGNRRNRPLSVYASSGLCPQPLSQNGSDISEYLNVSGAHSQSVQNIPQQLVPPDSQQNTSQTIIISLVDYVAAMWLRQAIEKLGGGEKRSVPLDDLMQEFISAPVNVRNTVGLTRVEVTGFLEKFSQLFVTENNACKNQVLDKSSTTFVISDTTSANGRSISLINKKGIAYCVCKSWGIIDLGQHEHVFFDRSLFKHVENLTKHFTVGETLCFNAVLAPKESRAKWRATRVWKESDTLAVQLSGLSLTSAANSLQEQNNFSLDSIGSSEDNSDSGVQDAIVQKPSSEMDNLLNNSEFNIVRLDVGDTEKLLVLQEPEELDDGSDDEDIPPLEKFTNGNPLRKSPPPGDQSDDNTSSDLNTMSDIPSISSCLPGSFVSSGTQTYFTGDILAKKVYHEANNGETAQQVQQ
ncbi:unnamed protein product [Hymenolepis diminuta]|uniref:Folliculin n=1 Tax=Hymenolepis diminuta TaxID=6216 RepID=A0A0R3SR73_HYMDI|nr:unnamed protein product [Hymenolepis diminuta]VUZ42050.1 unnamed protein product [Hymenolepis diminuta]